MSDTLSNLAFAAAGAALLAYAAAHLRPGSPARRAGDAALAATWLLETAYLAARWRAAGRPPLSDQFESVVALAWGVGALAYALRRFASGGWLAPATAAATALLLAAASLLDPTVAPLAPALRSNWLLLHVGVVLLAYAALALSCASAVFALSGRGDAEALDLFNERALGLGYVLLTAGIGLGAVWAERAWGSYWSWDPKETWALVAWLVYTAAVHLRRTHGWRGRRAAWLSVAGFAVVLFTYFGVNYLMSGLHSYARAASGASAPI